MEYYARKDDNQNKQLLTEHIEGVRKRCKDSHLDKFKSVLDLVSVIHDMGKFTVEWQNYMLEDLNTRVPHSIFGMAFLKDLMKDPLLNKYEAGIRGLLQDIVTYAIGAHHGLYDALTLNGMQATDQKIANALNNNELYEQAKKAFLSYYSYKELIKTVENALEECSRFINTLYSLPNSDVKHRLFYIGFLTRMVLSALMDADWSDAAAFFGDTEEKWKATKPTSLWVHMADKLEDGLKRFSADTRLNYLRKLISDECLASAQREDGIYKLDVPTGGAKTLSVMRFALAHAKRHDKKRILYMAPYKSILEQTAKVYKDELMGDDLNKDVFILEHHSDVVLEEYSDDVGGFPKYNDEYRTDFRKYLMDNWDAPVILTTMVQFLNTLFSGKKASIRRCHKLARSVIIIDEFQSIPSNSICLFNLAINALSKFFGATIVLCTATQPPYEESIGFGSKAIPSVYYEKPADLVGDYSKDEGFKRTKIINRTAGQALKVEGVKALIDDRMVKLNSLLVIVNTRDAAALIYHKVIESSSDYEVRILSNNMVPEHRRQVIDEVREMLKDREALGRRKLLVISTQLIEAGVDISFDGVIRSLAGLDSIAQAAGRCNRDGSGPMGEVWIVRLSRELEKTEKLEDIKTAQETMSALLEDFERNPEKYGNDLMSEEALRFYFKVYLEKTATKAGYLFEHDMFVKGKKLEALDLLTINTLGVNAYRGRNQNKIPAHALNQAFYTVGINYVPIEERGVTVLVPWGEGKDIVTRLNSEEGLFQKKKLLREATRYTIQIPNYKYRQLKEEGHIVMFQDDIPVLITGYDKNTGLAVDFEGSNVRPEPENLLY